MGIGLAGRVQISRVANAGLRMALAFPQATEVFLKKRRKARKPVMPMPRRASEAGSGTAEFAISVKPPVPSRGYVCTGVGSM